jgi:DNA-directed RNA polymerase specialized sigma24 family protein
MNNSLFDEVQSNNRLLKAVLQLLLQDYRQRAGEGSVRPELLLTAYGLNYQEVAEIVNKKPDAVRMLIKRNDETIKNIQKYK